MILLIFRIKKKVECLEVESRTITRVLVWGGWWQVGKEEMLIEGCKVSVRQEEWALMMYCTTWGLYLIIIDCMF